MNVASLEPEELAFFLARYRRGETLERFEPRLDHFLREILTKANEFVPSESGVILLDDPRAKILREREHQLTLVSAFGERASGVIGQRFAHDEGIAGHVYSTGQPTIYAAAEPGQRELVSPFAERSGLAVRSLLGVPVVLGNSICGVLLLINRAGREDYSREDATLITIFAGYISSSIQNMLDGMRAKELARRDDLTGLFNDRYFHFRLREEIAAADAQSADLALVFIDLDRFKEVNDRYGHLEGSRTLHEAGILLEHEAPPKAVIARYGGDEFVLILPCTDVVRAHDVADHIRRRLCTAPFLADHGGVEGATPDDRRLVVTASIGVATLHEHVPPGDGNVARRANTLIRMADAAMYRAKSEGRNRVVVSQSKTKEYPIAAPTRREPTDTADRGATEPGRGPGAGAASDLPGAPGALRDHPGHRRPG